MGTLSADWVAAMKLAAGRAAAKGTPWVLDPVGCGATPYRTAACLAMLRLRPAVVRGNASEILALAGAAGERRPRSAPRPARSVAVHRPVVACRGRAGDTDSVPLQWMAS
jgi:hydroxyethylthiazole kinase-like sugar kinase family protein